MKLKHWILLITILLIISIIVFVGYFWLTKEKNENIDQNQNINSQSSVQKKLELDPIKEATHFSKVAGEPGAYWMRGYTILWNDIEHEKGRYDWSFTDDGLQGKDDYFRGDVYHIAMFWPYANWDQQTCHQGDEYKATGHLKESGEDLMMGTPCDIEAYANFVEKVVERYDGDGVDDMPNLTVPIKYWEIMNEPEMQGGNTGGAGEDLKFFVGSSQEYYEILKASYEAIKKADPEAKVAHAGMAGIQDNFKSFWNPVFEAGGGNYIDIANIHTISTDELREDLYIIKFKKYLEEYGIKDKPIWITEVQFGSLMDKPKDLPAFEKLLARASIFALAQGADKLFLIENWIFWDDEKSQVKNKEEKPMPDLSNNSTHKVYQNLVKYLNSFDKIETIHEEYTENEKDNSGATSQIGQYKFINGDKIIYVLWGEAVLPVEITGQVKMIDIYGNSQTIDANNIVLSDSPIFIEKKID